MRRGGNEPAARRACARLCRWLGDRLARLFASACDAPSASRASGSPASSSSAMPAREIEDRPRPALSTMSRSSGSRQHPDFSVELSAIRCIMTA